MIDSLVGSLVLMACNHQVYCVSSMWLSAAGCLKLMEPFDDAVMHREEDQEPVGDQCRP